MTARELLAWSDLHDRRRRRSRHGVGSLPSVVWSLCAAVALCGEVARRLDSGNPMGASRLWLAVAMTINVVVVFGAPFRLFWRADSAFLGRLAIPGDTLFRLGLLRSIRGAAHALLVCGVGALAFGPLAGWEAAGRHLAMAGCGALGGALLGPAIALFAGATVASDRAMAVLESLGGEARAPRTTWLGTLPGFAATAVALEFVATANWLVGEDTTAVGPVLVMFGLAVGIPLAAVAIALAVARVQMTAAVREVAALDTERLAHVERTTWSPVEQLWARLTVPGGARVVYEKDSALARRRYPAPYFLGLVGVTALWAIAAAAPEQMLQWTGVLVGGLAVYAVIMSRRVSAPPVEHARYLRTLPVRWQHTVAAKRQQVALRILSTVIVGGAPVAARSVDSAVIAGSVLAVAMVALVVGVAVATISLGDE